jgi:hypothetical protein
MGGSPEKLDTSEVIASIRKCAQDGVRILGVDGFVAVPEGFVASLDLLLDVSGQNLTVDEAAAEAATFVQAKSRPDVVWEVWTEQS